MAKQYTSFYEFYAFYLTQHENTTCRRLHFVGSLSIILLILYVMIVGVYSLLWYIPFIGYGFAWLGHALFEKNKPATFTYPIYSLFGDWVMFKDMLVGKIKF